MGRRLFKIAVLLFVPMIALAATNEANPDQSLSLGRVAANMMEPVELISDFVQTACFVIGAAFLFTSVIKYVEHRRSPLMVPISTVIFLLIAGILLILLPFLYLLTEGIQYSLLKPHSH